MSTQQPTPFHATVIRVQVFSRHTNCTGVTIGTREPVSSPPPFPYSVCPFRFLPFPYFPIPSTSFPSPFLPLFPIFSFPPFWAEPCRQTHSVQNSQHKICKSVKVAYVATLPCETLLLAKQAINDKLQGSVCCVAAYLRGSGVVNKQIKKCLFIFIYYLI